MNKEECDYCVKRKTMYCPNSNECYLLDNLPYFQTKLDVLKENQELKKQLTTYQILHRDCKVDNLKNISKIEEMENQQKEFIEYLENEKDRLSRECSQIYEDSLGKTRLVNEDIFNEVDTILSKYKEIIGDNK